MTSESEKKDNRDNDFGIRDPHNHDRKVGRAVVRRQLPAWFNPLNVLTGLAITILLFAVFGTLADQLNTRLNQELIRIAIDQNDRMIKQDSLNLGIYLPVLLDLDEDIEQIKKTLNIPRESPDDRIHIDYNGTFISINNDRFNGTVAIPPFNVTTTNDTLHEEAVRGQEE